MLIQKTNFATTQYSSTAKMQAPQNTQKIAFSVNRDNEKFIANMLIRRLTKESSLNNLNTDAIINIISAVMNKAEKNITLNAKVLGEELDRSFNTRF